MANSKAISIVILKEIVDGQSYLPDNKVWCGALHPHWASCDALSTAHSTCAALQQPQTFSLLDIIGLISLHGCS